MDLWVQVKDEADAQRYLSFLNNYVNEQKKNGRFPRPLNNQLRSVSEWLESQRVVAATRARRCGWRSRSSRCA